MRCSRRVHASFLRMANPLVSPFVRWLGRLSFPRLFLAIGFLFVVDLLIPNLMPWDDLLLGLTTLLLARWKKKPGDGRPPIDGEVRR